MTVFMTDICLADTSLRDKEVARAYLMDADNTIKDVAEQFELSLSQTYRIIMDAQKRLADPFCQWLFLSHLKDKHIKEFLNVDS